jgi:phosphatidylinositol-3-phosphatase
VNAPRIAALALFAYLAGFPLSLAAAGFGSASTVFVILMENHNWSSIKGSLDAPYINSLLPVASHAEQYYNPPAVHPSEPN